MLMQEYEKLTRSEGCNPDTWCNLACCLFMLGMYSDADSASSRGELVLCSLSLTLHTLSVLSPHTAACAISTHCLCYLHTLPVLSPHTACAISTHCLCYLHTLSVLSPHTVCAISTHCLCYLHTLSVLSPHTVCAISTHCLCYLHRTQGTTAEQTAVPPLSQGNIVLSY